MKIKFKGIKLQNFMSFGNNVTEYCLDRDSVVLIIGDNRDVGESGDSRNGVGKTTLMNGIVYALFGKGVESLKADEYVNIVNEKGMKVSLEFEIGDDHYVINRSRKPNSVEFIKNGTSLTLDSMANTDELIQTTIGMDFDVFMTMFFLAPSKEPFMGMKPSQQRDIIEKILSLDTLSERANALKVIASDLNMELKLAQRDYENSASTLEKQESALLRAKTKHEEYIKSLSDKVEELRELIDEIDRFDFESELEKHDRIDSNKRMLSELNSKLAAEKLNLSEYKLDIASHERTINESEKQQQKAQEWEESHLARLKSLTERINSSDTTFEELEELEQELQDLSQARDALENDKRQLKRLTSSKETSLKQFDVAIKRLESLKAGVCPECEQPHHDSTLEQDYNLQCIEIESTVDGIDREIGELTESIEVTQKNIDDLEKSIGGITIDVVKSERRELEDAHNSLKNEKSQTNPYIDDGDTVDLAEIRDKLVLLEEKRGEVESVVSELESQVIDIEDEMRTTDKPEFSRSEIDNMINNVDNMRSEISEVEAKLATGESPFTDEIEIITAELVNPEELLDKVNDIETDVKHVKYLSKLLTDNKSFIRRNIVDQYIPYVNKKIVEYSGKLDLSHVAQINSDMSVDVEYMSRSVSFGSMSAGEKMRLNIATTAAFSDLLGILGGGSNLMLIDELFDSSLDPGGMHKAFKFVKDHYRNILMISHRQELFGEVDEVVRIVKENGFSSLEKS